MLLSQKFVPESPVNNKSALLQIMAWHSTGDKQSSEPMMSFFAITYICVTRPQWVKGLDSLCWIIFRKDENVFALSIISNHWDDVDTWNHSSWKIGTYLSYIINSMAADDLKMKESRASASMTLTLFTQNIDASALGILMHCPLLIQKNASMILAIIGLGNRNNC